MGGVDQALAGRVMWFDALVGNADRSWRNPNMLLWHGKLYLIDHGATLTFHHRWETAAASVARPDAEAQHLLELLVLPAGPGDPGGPRRSRRAPEIPAGQCG